MCSHHQSEGAEWVVRNRIFCDFIHRKTEPPPNDVKLDLVPAGEGSVELVTRQLAYVHPRYYG